MGPLTLLRTRCVTRQRRASLFATAGLAFTFAFLQAITVPGAYAPVAFGE
jgi:hypothetical protein